MKKIFAVTILLAVCLAFTSCGKKNSLPEDTSAIEQYVERATETEQRKITTTSEATVTTAEETTFTTTETEAASPFKDSEFYQYMQEWQGRFFYDVSFCDLDLDGHYELLLRSYDGRSFDTDIYSVYKLNDTEPKLYGYISLESGKSEYTVHTALEGKLYRYYDKEQGVYVIIGDDTKWDDGSFGQIQYNAIEYIFYSDKIYIGQISSFSGTDCCPAEYIRSSSDPDFSHWTRYVYSDGVFDLNGTEKFTDISDIVSEYEYIDNLDLDSLDKYTDIDEIMTMIKNYSGYDNVNAVLSPKKTKEYIDVLDMSGDKICKDDTYVSLSYSDNIVSDLEKITELENLTTVNLYYWGEDEIEIEIDLSPLKKCKNLMSISLPENISESTKRQISEFTELRYVNVAALNQTVSNADDFEYLKDLPYLGYIAVASDNDDPDYFRFLYDNKSIKWIRFDSSVIDEQIKRTIDNMPNVEAVTFGFSEV